jgi:hypothetical protein
LYWCRHKLLLCCLFGSSITALSSCSHQNTHTIQIAGVTDEPKQVLKLGAYEVQFFAAADSRPASVLIAKAALEACSIKIEDEKVTVMAVQKREHPSQTCDLLPTPYEFEAVKNVQESKTVGTIVKDSSVEDDRKSEATPGENSSAEDMTRSAVGEDGFSAAEELNRQHSKASDSSDSNESTDSASSTNIILENCPVITEKDILSKDNSDSYNYLLLRIGKDVDQSTIIENETCKLGSDKDANTKSLR